MLTVDFQTLALGSGQTLLDVGCGEGRHTLAAYLKSGVLALGVDLGLTDLQTARGLHQYLLELELGFYQTVLLKQQVQYDHLLLLQYQLSLN